MRRIGWVIGRGGLARVINGSPSDYQAMAMRTHHSLPITCNEMKRLRDRAKVICGGGYHRDPFDVLDVVQRELHLGSHDPAGVHPTPKEQRSYSPSASVLYL